MTTTPSTAPTPAALDNATGATRRHYIFAYGSLADPLRAEAIVGRDCQASFPEYVAAERVSARVSRFRRETSPLAHAVPDPAGTMDGYILGPLTDDEMARPVGGVGLLDLRRQDGHTNLAGRLSRPAASHWSGR
jgi:hypothetical protein